MSKLEGNPNIRAASTFQSANGRIRRGERFNALAAVSAFTLMEILIAIAIILILSALILTTAGYVQEKGRRSRAETEIAALSAACESYKADNGIYPQDGTTDTLDPTAPASVDPTSTAYSDAGTLLYKQLSGDFDLNPGTPDDDKTNYIAPLLKPSSLATPADGAPYLKDPWSTSAEVHAYGYSTSKASGGNGYNPTFDLWSTAGGKTSTDVAKWIKNW